MNVRPATPRALYPSGIENVPGSLLIFFVTLSSSIAVAVASGVPVDNSACIGLATAFVAAGVVGPLSGGWLQLCGSTIGMVVVVASIIRIHGFNNLGIIVLFAGLIQLAAGLLRFGQVIRAISPALLHGMLAGIGVLIFASQFHVMLNASTANIVLDSSGIVNLWTLPEAGWNSILDPDYRPAALIGLITIAAILYWKVHGSRELSMLATVAGIIFATVCVALLDLNVEVLSSSTPLLSAITPPTLAGLGRLTDGTIWIAGLTLAFVANARSMLTATEGDPLHSENAQYNRELTALGIGNILCGFLGVLPVAGVIARTSPNHMVGKQTWISGIFSGACIVIAALLLPTILALIPIASLAAVLVFMGLASIRTHMIDAIGRRLGRLDMCIYAITLVTIVLVDLFTGIFIGTCLTFMKLMYLFLHLEATVVTKVNAAGSCQIEPSDTLSCRLDSDRPSYATTTVIRLKGGATFLRLPQLAATLEAVPPQTLVHVHFNELAFIDETCLEYLVNWNNQHKATGGKSVLHWTGLSGIFSPVLPRTRQQ